MKTLFFVICMIAGILLYSMWEMDKNDRENWNYSVELAKKIPWSCNPLTPTFVIPPKGLKSLGSRIILMGHEIESSKFNTLQFKPGSGGFVVFYDGQQLGSCSIQ